MNPTLPSLYVCHSSFSNPSVASSTSQLSPTLPSLYLCHSSFSYPSLALPMSAHSPTLMLLHQRHSTFFNLLLLLLRHRIFTYVTWRAAHVAWEQLSDLVVWGKRPSRLPSTVHCHPHHNSIVASPRTLTCRYSFDVKRGVMVHCYTIIMDS